MTNSRDKIVIAYPYIEEEAIKAVQRVMQNRWIGQGGKVDEFEAAVRDAFAIPYTVAVNCSSAALRLALAIAGVGPGDEVITTPQCCTATNHPILEQFATPVFADIQYLTGNINPEDIEKRITARSKAIIGVDLGGYPCDADELKGICERNGLAFIEDASDAIGARYKDRYIGATARFTVFSFGAVQQITTGEGGMLCCINEDDSESSRRRRWYGIDRKSRTPTIDGYYDFDVTETGYGYHMTNIAAAMGLVHLASLEKLLAHRSEIVKKYQTGLSNVQGVQLFEQKENRVSSCQLFTIQVEDRGSFCKMMNDKGIDVSIIHARNDQYAIFGGIRDDLPVVHKYAKTNISLPLHNKLTDDDVGYVIKCISEGW